jgi:glycosyltransferase involved in cell wall biosynthesis
MNMVDSVAASGIETSTNMLATAGPRISVAIPVWNDSRWLPGAIESVLAQTYQNWELVIGDNASDEDLAAIAGRYDDPRICYHRFRRHVDASESHNRTMALCRYEWIQLLCADDRLQPRCLERVAARLAEASPSSSRVVMLITACRRIDATGQPTDIVRSDHVSYRPLHLQAIADGRYDASAWLRANAAWGVRPWMIGSVAIAGDLFAEIGGFRPEMGLCHDLELVMRMAAYGDVVYVDEPLLDYTVRTDSITSALVRRHVRQGTAMVEAGAAWLSILRVHEARRKVGHEEREVIFAAIARAFLQRALLHATDAEGHGRGAALLDVARACWYSPRTTVLTWRLAVALAAVLAPGTLIDRARVLGHRLGLVVI